MTGSGDLLIGVRRTKKRVKSQSFPEQNGGDKDVYPRLPFCRTRIVSLVHERRKSVGVDIYLHCSVKDQGVPFLNQSSYPTISDLFVNVED